MANRGDEDPHIDEDDVDEELGENEYKSQKDAVLFAIDVSGSMMKPPPASDSKKADKDSAIAAALKSAYQIMQQRIISQPKDMMGILLFGTEKSKFRDESNGRGGTGYPRCYLFTDLDVPAAEDVKALKSLVEEGEDPDEVLVPSQEPVVMSNVLFCANQIFTTNAPNFGSRRLFIITDNDNPHSGDKNARSAAAVRAKDLYDLGVIIELFPINRGDTKFDMSKFYDDIIYRDPNAEAGSPDAVKTSKSGDGLTLLSSLVSNINSKQTPKRAYFSNMPFMLGPGLTISISGYNVIHRQQPARTCYIWLDGEKAQIATGETTKMEAESTRTVEKTDIKKAYKFGGEFVYFTPEEQKSLREYGGKILRIIGFKPRSSLPLWASVKNSVYLFPSEADYVGSTRVFSALWQKLLKSKKIGLAWYVARANATPRLVALVPSKKQSDEDSGTPFLPEGLWLYPLPFADDLREIERQNVVSCSSALIDQMRPIIQNLQLPKAVYNPSRYPNPALQWHYKILQALALEEEVPEPGDDPTVPRYKAINSRVGGYLEDWTASVAEEAKSARDGRAMKRGPEEDEDSRPAKRTKAAPAGAKKGAAGMSNADLKKVMGQGTLSKMTVAEIKDVLASKGLDYTGKKAELVERVEQWLEDNA